MQISARGQVEFKIKISCRAQVEFNLKIGSRGWVKFGIQSGSTGHVEFTPQNRSREQGTRLLQRGASGVQARVALPTFLCVEGLFLEMATKLAMEMGLADVVEFACRYPCKKCVRVCCVCACMCVRAL